VRGKSLENKAKGGEKEMNMLGIDFAQMFAPRSAGQGSVIGDGSGAEGFLAALQQLGWRSR
jgi:hypothetical protein